MGKFYKSFRKNLMQYALDVPYVTLVLVYFIVVWIPFHFGEWMIIWGFLLASSPFVLPVLFCILAAYGWLEYKQQQKYWSTEHVLLEIKLPEEITQSPYAAELLIRTLYDTGEVDTPAHLWFGNTSPWFSLEIASTEGAVRFYIWTRVKFKERIKSQLYAHYPTVQVAEVSDYTLAVPWNSGDYDLWGVEQCLQKPDPYPIMTYVAWGLDKADTEEEFKSDPLNSVIEFMGSIGPGEHVWSQIILRGHTKCYWSEDDEDAHYRALPLNKWAEVVVDKLGKKYVDKTAEGKSIPNFSRLPDNDKEAIKAIGQKLNKPIFDVGIRTIYIARKDVWKGGIRNNAIPTMFRSFEHGSKGIGLNGLKPIFYIGPFNVKWHDFMGIRRRLLKAKLYRGYVTRQYFYPPNKDFHIALNTEELASLWHFPGKVAHTPTLQRMPSRRAEAPANLPI
ncbi:MAG: hypothetical protein ABSE76_02535 [Minisyncoccia bacterium]